MVSDSQQGQIISRSVGHTHKTMMDRTIKRIQDITNKTRTLFSPVVYIAHNLSPCCVKAVYSLYFHNFKMNLSAFIFALESILMSPSFTAPLNCVVNILVPLLCTKNNFVMHQLLGQGAKVKIADCLYNHHGASTPFSS